MTPEQPEHAPAMTREEIEAHLNGLSLRRQRFNRVVTTLVDRVLHALERHWLAIVNGVLAVFIGIAFVVPLGYAVGLTGPSSAVFDFYRFMCGQTPSHSFYIAGYQMCLCSRCLSIYSALLVGGLLLAMFRHRRNITPVSWRVWLLGMLPMALDGGTQLFGWHESNVYLRLLTGAIFGLMTAWFILPQIQQSMVNEPAAASTSAPVVA